MKKRRNSKGDPSGTAAATAEVGDLDPRELTGEETREPETDEPEEETPEKGAAARDAGDVETPDADPDEEASDPPAAEERSATEINAALKADRQRAFEVKKLTRKHGIEDDRAEEFVRDGYSINRVRKLVLEHVERRTKDLPIGTGVRVGLGPRDQVRSGVEEALLFRTGKLDKLPDRARPHAGMSLLELARTVLRSEGHNLDGLGKMEVAGMALGMRAIGLHGTTDFTKILANVQQKFVEDPFMAAPRTFLDLSKRVSANDFKTMQTAGLGLGSTPKELIKGNGPIEFGSFTDYGETYGLRTYAIGVGITRQALVNDDANVLSAIPEAFGEQMALLENRLAWALITGNVVMADGLALFTSAAAPAGHQNDLAGGSDLALSLAAMSAMRAKLRMQVDPDLNRLSLRPRWLIVPAQLETVGQQLVTSITANVTTNVNVFAGTGLIVEPELDGVAGGLTRVFMATDKAQRPVFNHAYLDGNDRPRIETSNPFELDGFATKATHDFGIVLANHRAIVRDNGTT